jgi:SAM-dependent methyltransferase
MSDKNPQESKNKEFFWNTPPKKDLARLVRWTSIKYFDTKYSGQFFENKTRSVFLHKLLKKEAPNKTNFKGASLACGDMTFEVSYFKNCEVIKFDEIYGYDLSETLLGRVNFENDSKFIPNLVDCNNLILNLNFFDLIVCHQAIHHIYNLGNLFYQCNKALNDDGIFYMSEWIGPKYLKIPITNHIAASILLFLLFPSRKTRTNHEGNVKGIHVSFKHKRFDPSEACNSKEIMPQFYKYFEPVKILGYGGIAYPMFQGIAQNIDQDKKINQLKIKLVYYVELILTKLKIIKPLFVYAIGKKKKIYKDSD